jgi:hypothetical protein
MGLARFAAPFFIFCVFYFSRNVCSLSFTWSLRQQEALYGPNGLKNWQVHHLAISDKHATVWFDP